MKHQISSNSLFKTVPLHNKEIKMALTIWQVTLTEERSRTDYRNVPIYVTISHLKRRSLSTLESPQHLTIFLPMGVRYFHVITTLQSQRSLGPILNLGIHSCNWLAKRDCERCEQIIVTQSYSIVTNDMMTNGVKCKVGNRAVTCQQLFKAQTF